VHVIFEFRNCVCNSFFLMKVVKHPPLPVKKTQCYAVCREAMPTVVVHVLPSKLHRQTNRLKGKKHKAKIQVLLEECNSMARDPASSWEVDWHPSTTSQDEEKSDSAPICLICQVKWSCQSVMEAGAKLAPKRPWCLAQGTCIFC
jgi:hypothetical protein